MLSGSSQDKEKSDKKKKLTGFRWTDLISEILFKSLFDL